jgi:hypothetical protein
MNNRPTSWRMPNPKQMEKLAGERAQPQPAAEPAPDASPPAEWWESVLSDPRAVGKWNDERVIIFTEYRATSWSPGHHRSPLCALRKRFKRQ